MPVLAPYLLRSRIIATSAPPAGTLITPSMTHRIEDAGAGDEKAPATSSFVRSSFDLIERSTATSAHRPRRTARSCTALMWHDSRRPAALARQGSPARRNHDPRQRDDSNHSAMRTSRKFEDWANRRGRIVQPREDDPSARVSRCRPKARSPSFFLWDGRDERCSFQRFALTYWPPECGASLAPCRRSFICTERSFSAGWFGSSSRPCSSARGTCAPLSLGMFASHSDGVLLMGLLI